MGGCFELPWQILQKQFCSSLLKIYFIKSKFYSCITNIRSRPRPRPFITVCLIWRWLHIGWKVWDLIYRLLKDSFQTLGLIFHFYRAWNWFHTQYTCKIAKWISIHYLINFDWTKKNIFHNWFSTTFFSVTERDDIKKTYFIWGHVPRTVPPSPKLVWHSEIRKICKWADPSNPLPPEVRQNLRIFSHFFSKITPLRMILGLNYKRLRRIQTIFFTPQHPVENNSDQK